MNISGVLVRTLPANIESVGALLGDIEGIEVHGSNDDGRMVVTIEQQDAGRTADLLANVRSASLLRRSA